MLVQRDFNMTIKAERNKNLGGNGYPDFPGERGFANQLGEFWFH